MNKAIQIRLSDRSTVWIEPHGVEEEQEVAQRTREGRLIEVMPTVVTLSRDLIECLKKVSPTKAAIEFGLGFRLESSGLALLIAKGGAEANFKITLEWSVSETHSAIERQGIEERP